jgi:hypothetical protein
MPQVTMEVMHWPWHAELLGVQQVPASSSQMPAPLQLTVLLAPQFTGKLQLFIT